MKHFRVLTTILLTACLLAALPAVGALAQQATSYTYTLEKKSGSYEFPRTQDAYLPDKTITTLGLENPSDIFIDGDDMMYIADTGNKRIVKYDIANDETVGEIKGFSTPMGVFVTPDGTIYVADNGEGTVVKLSRDFEVLAKIGRPVEPSFSDTNFSPMKVAVDNAGNIYIVSEGVYNGIIQLAGTGEFLGYFAVNKTVLSFSQMLRKLLFTRDQLANLTDIEPMTFSNVFVDRDGIVYSSSMGVGDNCLKKHNTSGGNMFLNGIVGYSDLTDVTVDGSGNIYTATQTGYIEIYSKNGEFIFSFGSSLINTDIAGLFTSLPAIAVDSAGHIWAVDGDKGYLQSFRTTDYAELIYGALGLYEQGRYAESLESWNEVLRLNQMSTLAHDGVGKALFHAQRYEESLEHFKVAENREYYSEAFWEVRNDALQRILPYVFFGILFLIILFAVIGRVDKKKVISRKKTELADRLLDVPVLGAFLYMFRVARHPSDRYYDIRIGSGAGHGMASPAGATVIYIAAFAGYMLYTTKKGFIYQYVAVEDMDIGGIVAGFFTLITLFVICNYLVTSINDGDGTLRTVYMLPAYSLAPMILCWLAVTGLSYGMTYNESFILTIIRIVCILWTAVNLFCGVMNIHDYSFKETVKSFVMTLFFMIVAIIIILIVVIMVEQLWSFIASVGRELVLNVI